MSAPRNKPTKAARLMKNLDDWNLSNDPSDWPVQLKEWSDSLDDSLYLCTVERVEYGVRPLKKDTGRRFYGLEVLRPNCRLVPTSHQERVNASKTPLRFPGDSNSPTMSWIVEKSPVQPCYYLGSLVTRSPGSTVFHSCSDYIVVILLSNESPSELAFVLDFVGGPWRFKLPEYRISKDLGFSLSFANLSWISDNKFNLVCESGFRFGWLSALSNHEGVWKEHISSTFAYEDAINEEVFHDLYDFGGPNEWDGPDKWDPPNEPPVPDFRDESIASGIDEAQWLAGNRLLAEQFLHRSVYGPTWVDVPLLEALRSLSGHSSDKQLRRAEAQQMGWPTYLELLVNGSLKRCWFKNDTYFELTQDSDEYWAERMDDPHGETTVYNEFCGIRTYAEPASDYIIMPLGQLRVQTAELEFIVFWDLRRKQLALLAYDSQDTYDAYLNMKDASERRQEFNGESVSVALLERDANSPNTYTLQDVSSSGYWCFGLKRVDGEIVMGSPDTAY